MEGNRDTVLEPSGQPCYYSYNKLSTQNFIGKYFVGNLITAAPPQYSSAIRLCRQCQYHHENATRRSSM